jgi:hypothetical protein
MGGIRLGGSATPPLVCSPPFAAYQGTGTVFTGDPQVWRSCEADAPGEATQYTNFSGFVDADQCGNPVLSPDGTKILFDVLSATTGYDEIWVVDAIPGSTPTPLVQDASNYVMHPAWGADSDTFVYVHGAGGGTNGGTIYKDTVSSPGSPVALKVATGGFSPYRPQFNFDGSRIAYIWDKDLGAGGDLRCMDEDGTNDASLDNTIGGYFFNQPTQFSWANTQNVIAYVDISSSPFKAYVIDDAGAGKTQLNASGDAAGAPVVISRYAWPSDDSFVLITANLGLGFYSMIRTEVDGSGSTALNGSHGAVVQGYYSAGLVSGGRIWFIDSTDASAGQGKVSSLALDGTDYVNNLNTSAGAGDQVYPFTGGDGWYYN